MSSGGIRGQKLISDHELMTIHVEALFTHDASLRLEFINEPWVSKSNRRPSPRFFLGRTVAGNIWRFRSDLPTSLVKQLEVLCVNEPVTSNLSRKPKHFEAYVRLLEAQEPIQQVWIGPTYHIPRGVEPSLQLVPITDANAEVLGAGFSEIRPELGKAQPFFGIIRGDHTVSICRSVRITSRGHEAGVETLSDYRGKGYAAAVIIGWTAAVNEMGCVPLYSTSWENMASQNVARKVGAIRYGVNFHVT